MVQIVSRGNGLSSFLTVDTTDNTINIKQYREVGPKRKFNNDFVQSGLLTIDKSNPNEPQISSSGELDILDDVAVNKEPFRKQMTFIKASQTEGYVHLWRSKMVAQKELDVNLIGKWFGRVLMMGLIAMKMQSVVACV